MNPISFTLDFSMFNLHVDSSTQPCAKDIIHENMLGNLDIAVEQSLPLLPTLGSGFIERVGCFSSNKLHGPLCMGPLVSVLFLVLIAARNAPQLFGSAPISLPSTRHSSLHLSPVDIVRLY